MSGTAGGVVRARAGGRGCGLSGCSSGGCKTLLSDPSIQLWSSVQRGGPASTITRRDRSGGQIGKGSSWHLGSGHKVCAVLSECTRCTPVASLLLLLLRCKCKVQSRVRSSVRACALVWCARAGGRAGGTEAGTAGGGVWWNALALRAMRSLPARARSTSAG